MRYAILCRFIIPVTAWCLQHDADYFGPVSKSSKGCNLVSRRYYAEIPDGCTDQKYDQSLSLIELANSGQLLAHTTCVDAADPYHDTCFLEHGAPDSLSRLDRWRKRNQLRQSYELNERDGLQIIDIGGDKGNQSKIDNSGDISRQFTADSESRDTLVNYTTVRCNGATCCDSLHINRSCSWTNLYYISGAFRALVSEGDLDDEDSLVVSIGIRRPAQWEDRLPTAWLPSIERFATPDHLACFLDDARPAPRPGVHLLFARSSPFNFGHAVLDDLYAVWLALLTLSPGGRPPIGPLTGIVLPVSDKDSCCGPGPPGSHAPGDAAGRAACCRAERAIAAFLGAPLEFVAAWPAAAAYRFEAAVAGVGQMGMMTPTRDYRLPGAGWPSAPLRRFRDRFYAAHGLPPPVAGPRGGGSDGGKQGLRVLLVPNKRDYGDALDPAAMGAVLLAAQERGGGGGGGGGGAVVSLLDFGAPLADQLRALGACDVLVTGVGTGATVAFLLRDGAAGVNLGTDEFIGTASFNSDEPVIAAADWTRWAFAQPHARASAVAIAQLVLATAAAAAAGGGGGGRAADDDPGKNLSPVGRVAAGYFRVDAAAWAAYVGAGSAAGRPDVECLNGVTRAELLVCERGPWAAAAAAGGGGCADLDRLALRRLRAAHGVECGPPPPPALA
jgi:hypothetical protein